MSPVRFVAALVGGFVGASVAGAALALAPYSPQSPVPPASGVTGYPGPSTAVSGP